MPDPQESQSQPASEFDSSTSERKRRGRPPGSKNKTSATSVVIPDTCGKCQSTEFDVLNTPRQMQAKIVILGVEYNHITWRRCQCKRCGNVVMRKFYRNI